MDYGHSKVYPKIFNLKEEWNSLSPSKKTIVTAGRTSLSNVITRSNVSIRETLGNGVPTSVEEQESQD